jgi:hypothetical protein
LPTTISFELNPLKQGIIEGENPVCAPLELVVWPVKESGCLGMQLKNGGKFHLKLNINRKPIANKYREGKMKRTLKRESKVREIVDREMIGYMWILVCPKGILLFRQRGFKRKLSYDVALATP